MDEKRGSPKFLFTGLGLVFGAAIGIIIALALRQSIFWAGIGTGVGLIIGAIIDSMKNR
ncbi:MAG: hypothetical protein GX756_00060 [Clostridiales bacterium]|jgi:hypothetical protein|nr:hypothetical protein [Clostridiales bacterium]